jgi:hypothetical protein
MAETIKKYRTNLTDSQRYGNNPSLQKKNSVISATLQLCERKKLQITCTAASVL